MNKLYIAYRYSGNKELDIPPYYDWFIVSGYKADKTDDIYTIYDVLRSMIVTRYNVDDMSLIKNEDIIIVFMKELHG